MYCTYHNALLWVVTQSSSRPMATGQDTTTLCQKHAVKLTQDNLREYTKQCMQMFITIMYFNASIQ